MILNSKSYPKVNVRQQGKTNLKKILNNARNYFCKMNDIIYKSSTLHALNIIKVLNQLKLLRNSLHLIKTTKQLRRSQSWTTNKLIIHNRNMTLSHQQSLEDLRETKKTIKLTKVHWVALSLLS